jgi:hypothetical protein
MTPMLSILKTSGRAAIVALTLGAASITAMPAAQAQTPSFSFNFGLSGQGDPSLSFGVDSGRRGDRNFRRACLGDRQIIRGLRDAGFRDVQIGDDLSRNRVEAFGRYRNALYSMRVNRCTGAVDRIERLRRGGGGSGGGFGLQFNY